MTFDSPIRNTRRLAFGAAFAALLSAGSVPAHGAATNISDEPLASGASADIRPNVLFILDDSGSMDWGYMPNSVSFNSSKECYKHYAYNRLWYNPDITYSPPPKGDGTFYPDQSWPNAMDNGFDPASSTTHLGNSSFYKWYSRHNGTPTVGTCHNDSQYTPVTVSDISGPGSKDERINYANWYSYYRTRMQSMKSAAGFAFDSPTLLDKYRIGFITINFSNSSEFLAIKDFDATHKKSWFDILYAQNPASGTPLRTALARAGRHFAGRADGINSGMGSNDGAGKLDAASDPILYSCQQNFAILTTDGYWNDGSNPVRIDGITPIGDQDFNLSVTPRPLFERTTNAISFRSRITRTTEAYSACSDGRTRIIETEVISERTLTFSNGAQTGDNLNTLDPDVSTAEWCSWSPRALKADSCPARTVGPDASGDTHVFAAEANCTETFSDSQTNGNPNTLADVAQYYYANDLRGPGDLGGTITLPDASTYREDVGTVNNVPKNGDGVEDDKAAHQHMTTFTLGMGVPGTLAYSPDYKSGAGDFAAIRAGTKNWPVPVDTDPKKSDDLWHAAVNGRGVYFSASEPSAIASSLLSALSGVSARVASAAAAATSNLEPVAGDNFAYVASYQTQKWNGDIQARSIDLETGIVGQTNVWSARDKLQSKVGTTTDTRDIYTFDASDAADKLKSFLYANLSASEQAFFNASVADNLTQWGSVPLNATQQGNADDANLVNYLRGQYGYEDRTTNAADDRVFRAREYVLGDIVNAQPIYVRSPFFDYNDAGYKGANNKFKESNDTREPMVYVASNDGMLHAFYAGTSTTDSNGGVERWAYIPSVVLSNMYRLADSNYATNHQFLVDGTPTVGDVCIGAECGTTASASNWKTILVAGLNKGGKAYYALDVTNPGSPKALWEFKHSTTCYDATVPATHYADCHLGYTYGNPLITKRSDGKWVVLVTSGYNNVNDPAITGDGVGYLYVLDAADGKILDKISTGAGDATTPSGLAKINNWVDDALSDNTTLRVYGGDLLGNIWRFDINNTLVPSGKDAFKLAQVTDGTNPQPITTKPELSLVGSDPIVYVATGRYLGDTDLNDTQQQSVYGIKDTKLVSHCVAVPPATCTDAAAPATITGLRTGTLVQQTMTNTVDATGGTIRTIACTASCDASGGWYVDLPDSKERVNVDIKLQLGTLIVASNVPGGSACTIGGSSWINFFDFATGGVVSGSTSNSVGRPLSNSLAVGLNVVRLPSGKTVVIATTSDNQQLTVEAPFANPNVTGRRVSWREIFE